jgi:UDP-3-O-[3-hydroxymyristoyl] glucosamine N-acyltransferase
MMPNSIISGNCKVGNKVYFGSNASTAERIEICDNVTLGLNSGVVGNILDFGTYAGTPAKKLR